MHVRNKFNVKQIAGLTAPGIYSDGGGLYLRVRPTGSRSWLYVCMIKGKRRELGLGSVHDVSLAKAREKAAEAREHFLNGRDPVKERARALVAQRPVATFGKFAEQLMDDIEDGFRNEKHRKQWRSTLRIYAKPILDMAVQDVTTEDVLGLLMPIWLKTPETASRVRGRIERVLDAAKAKGHRQGENPARWRGHLELLLPRRKRAETKHHAALPFDQVATFMTELRKRQATAARALEFTILTAARSGETIGMTWGEIDLAECVWTIPGERMKAGATHQVPLSDAAIAVLTALKPGDPTADQLVFANDGGRQLSNMAMAMLLRRMGYDGITVHGFRSTFRDWAGESTAFGREEIEMALAHTIESAVERAYRRGRALEKRRELMSAWASACFSSN